MCIMHQRFYTGKASSLGLLLAVGGSTSQRWKRSPRVLVIKQRRGQQQHSHSCASRTDLAAELQQCDSSDDWVKAVEIFAEVCNQARAWGREDFLAVQYSGYAQWTIKAKLPLAGSGPEGRYLT